MLWVSDSERTNTLIYDLLKSKVMLTIDTANEKRRAKINQADSFIINGIIRQSNKHASLTELCCFIYQYIVRAPVSIYNMHN